MYNKNMVKRASKQDAPISKGINKIALGFTIIETMLFLAIAGLIFAGLVAGTNGAIRRQRYKDSVQGFVDDLRDLYSLVENTQVLKYDGTAKCADGTDGSEGRGRSNCSVYGIYAIISPNHGNKNTIEAYWVIGTDQSLVRGASSDIEFFKDYAQIGTAYTKTDGVEGSTEHINVKSHSILWGADVAIPCNSDFATDIKNAIGTVRGCDAVGSVLSNAQNQVELFIYRSPITGSINTLSSMKVDDTANASDVIELDQAFKDGEDISYALESNHFNHYDVSLCVTGGSGMSYDGGIRMVVIDAYGSNTNAVRLIEADADENKCN